MYSILELSHKKTIAILLVIILLAVLAPQHQASAFCASISGCAQEITSFMIRLVGTAIAWAAQTLNAFIQYQTDNGVYNIFAVDQSWTVVRNFVNLFFILVLIIMAFGTIFDIKKYTWQDLLPSFIIAALLINFSLVIGQYIITLSNGLAGVFLKTIADNGGLSEKFAQGFSQVKIVSSASTIGGALDATGAIAITGVFSLIWFIIIFLAFLSVAIFSIARLFVLWFLLIVSPIAWLGYAMPYIKKQTWTDWWTNFLCWCFFLPYYLFFLMFAVGFIANKDKIPAIPGSASIAVGSIALNDLLLYGVSLIFLVGGLWVAMKMACASGTGVKKVFSTIEGGVRKYAPGAAYVRGGIAGLKERGAEITEKGILGIGGAQRARLQEATAKGFVAGGRPGMVEERNRALSTEVDKEVKRLQLLNLTLDQLNERLTKGSSPEKLAAFKLKAENGWLEASDLSNINKMLDDVGGGKTAIGASIIASLKKGKFNEMAQTTAQKEFIFDHLEDVEVKKAFGLDMAESREIMNDTIAKQLLDLYANDTKEVQNKVSEVVKNNIENFARDKNARKALLNNSGADQRIRKLTANIMTDKGEITNYKNYRIASDLFGGENTPASRDLRAKLAKDDPLATAEIEFRETLGLADPAKLDASYVPTPAEMTAIVPKFDDKMKKMDAKKLADAERERWLMPTFKTALQNKITYLEGIDPTIPAVPASPRIAPGDIDPITGAVLPAGRPARKARKEIPGGGKRLFNNLKKLTASDRDKFLVVNSLTVP